MRDITEIKAIRRLGITNEGLDGIQGIISMPRWTGSIIFSWGGGWEHLSVCPLKKSIMPTWDDMCMIKELFFEEEEAVIQIHPPKAEYVNNMPNCLHLWRCRYKDMVLPPSCFVGLKKGQTLDSLRAEIKKAYEEAGEEYR